MISNFLKSELLNLKSSFSIIIILFLFTVSPADAAFPAKVRVTKVHDGNTVSIRISRLSLKTERVRLIGMDAPELGQEPWGRRAKRHLKKLISDSDWIVRIELDINERDKYGRLLAYLWTDDKKLINERMIEDGYAVLYTIPPNVKHVERLIAAQKKAQTRKTGIWGKGGLRETPEEWRREHPRN
ncbi:MAG: thermonuclease family protein [Thermodesulfovibrionales bacterium]|nr:thermonuclease family protein [Thermodesulfovibrionales bacterium]